MEHRRRFRRIDQCATGAATRASDAHLLRRCLANGDGNELSDRGRLSWRAQYSSRDRGCQWPPNGPQRTKSILRAANNDQSLTSDASRSLIEKKESRRGSDRRGNGGSNGGPQRTADVFDHLNTGVVILDCNFLIEDLNAAAENILSISWARAQHQSLLQLLGDDQEFGDILDRVQRDGSPYASEIRLPPTEASAEDRFVDCRVSAYALPEASDGLLIEMSDVTRRTRISRENSILIQHGAGRQMIRQLAHEIKNPLGGLRGAAQLLERQLQSEELKEYTEVIIGEADRLAALVDTLLGPGGPPNKRAQNIHEILEYVIRLVEPELKSSLRINRDYDPGLPEIELDRDQIVQAFLNLLRNAVSALDGQGQITLRTRAVMNFTIGATRYPSVAAIEFEDDGPGIAPELQDSIFYPLVTNRADGTGLGLPAAQELISRHGGLIEFSSRPGRTVFQVLIPLKAQVEFSG